MTDPIDRAAEVIYSEALGLPAYSPTAVDDHNRHSYRGNSESNESDRVEARNVAQALSDAGLLVNDERDAEQQRVGAERVLREAADECFTYAYKPGDASAPPADQAAGYLKGAEDAHNVVDRLLRERADRIAGSK